MQRLRRLFVVVESLKTPDGKTVDIGFRGVTDSRKIAQALRKTDRFMIVELTFVGRRSGDCKPIRPGPSATLLSRQLHKDREAIFPGTFCSE